jgi:hypothetical protein
MASHIDVLTAAASVDLHKTPVTASLTQHLTTTGLRRPRIMQAQASSSTDGACKLTAP